MPANPGPQPSDASSIQITGASLGTPLMSLLTADQIEPGSDPSYQLCKTIYLYHPMGAKIVEAPIKAAMYLPRQIMFENPFEKELREAFEKEWRLMQIDGKIKSLMYQSRIYGVSSVALIVKGRKQADPIPPFELDGADIQFNILDPLNTAGSLVLNQNPNALDFQKNLVGISIAGERVHPSRCLSVMNEEPIYIAYTSSSFGYVGRSTYQRALFPLKSYINTMVTNDMVSRKAGLLIAKMKGPGSIINNMMRAVAGIKRAILQQGQTNNVVNIDIDEDIETLNMQNADTAMGVARKNIIEDIATGSGQPAKLLLQESFAEGFGEGSEDARYVAQYIDEVRTDMEPVYAFFDRIVMYRAWNKAFYLRMKSLYPDVIGTRSYEDCFFEWRDAFRTAWPSLIKEPESEVAKRDKVKLEGIRDVVEVLSARIDPENFALLAEWVQDNVNEQKNLFRHDLSLDFQALAEYEPPVPMGGEGGADDKPGGSRKDADDKPESPRKRYLLAVR